MVFLTMANNIFSIKEDQEGNKMQGHWHDINLENQILSQVDKDLM
jgi:hypothetical protein